MYSLFIQCGHPVIQPGHDSILHHLRSVYQQGATPFLEAGNNQTVIGRDCAEDVQPWLQLYLHLPRVKVRRATARGNFQHRTEHQKSMIDFNKTGAQTVCANVLYFLEGLRIYLWTLNSVFRIPLTCSKEQYYSEKSINITNK